VGNKSEKFLQHFKGDSEGVLQIEIIYCIDQWWANVFRSGPKKKFDGP